MKILERFFYSVRRRTIRVDVQRSAALRTRLKLWFPPKVWLQRSQSTRIGGLLAVNGQFCASACWFEQSILCALITPFGGPARGEEDLRDRLGAHRVKCRLDCCRGSGCQELREQRHLTATSAYPMRR